MKKSIFIINASQIASSKGAKARFGEEMKELQIIEDGAVVIEEGIIKAIGTTEELLSKYSKEDYEVIDAKGKTILPGFVDSHTHFIFGGYRAEEFSWRLNGVSYMEIMERGGGIINTVRSTKETPLEELIELGRKRLDSMMKFGVTTVEGKSGYGLDLDTEVKQLEAMRRLSSDHPMDIVSTFLGAHAVPKEYKGKEEEYVSFIIDEVLPKVNNLAEFCDVFCEKNVFSVEQSRRILLKAKELGMKLKLHADEIVQLGGAELAGELGATSADHLLQASDKGIESMRENDVIATLLPCTAFSLRESYARGREMIDRGCAVALATDFNPGSCFTYSIPLLFALACIEMRLTIEEAITALTINGAAALGKAHEIGTLDIGKKADLVILSYPSYKYIPYHVGINIVEKVIKNGEIVVNN